MITISLKTILRSADFLNRKMPNEPPTVVDEHEREWRKFPQETCGRHALGSPWVSRRERRRDNVEVGIPWNSHGSLCWHSFAADIQQDGVFHIRPIGTNECGDVSDRLIHVVVASRLKSNHICLIVPA